MTTSSSSSSSLLNLSLGNLAAQSYIVTRTTPLVYAVQQAPGLRFDGRGAGGGVERRRAAGAGSGPSGRADEDDDGGPVWAHRAGVTALAVDRFEGRLMLSGGADPSIYVWDLENGAGHTNHEYTLRPVAAVPGGAASHKFGITHLSFYPFDALAFLSSSYDHTLKIYATETRTPSASFDLDSVVYSHALSPIASHLLVACATQNPAVRLVDLRSGASTHSLAGHGGAVLSVAWSPREEHVLASGGVDGNVALWDVRRSASALGVLDMNRYGGMASSAEGAQLRRRHGSHVGPVNGVVWTDDGRHVVSCGHDRRIRVWEFATRTNTLANFGPSLKNAHLSTTLPLLVPSQFLPPGMEVMFYPNERDILMFDLLEGTLLKSLRPVGTSYATPVQGGQRNASSRVTSLAWRAGSIELYSAHTDGVIRTWMPRTREEAELDEEEARELDQEDETKKRKRKVLDDVYQSLTRQKITFS